MIKKDFKYAIIALFLVLLAATAPARAEKADIIWYTPPVADKDYQLSPPSCALADSDFLLSWLSSRGRMPMPERPRVVVVIDDMGIDRKRSDRVAQLPSSLTLAFLPYARHVQAQVDAAAQRGHSIMMHIPMQPQDVLTDPGPNVLDGRVSRDELLRRITANLDSFKGYSGVNNHMGSAFTQDRAGLEALMSELTRRGLFFLDSKTHPQSIAQDVAATAGVVNFDRDIFLDHVETAEGVAAALHALERRARRDGLAIAIGHPKDVTIAALANWLPQLEARGIVLMSMDALQRERRQQALSAISR